MLADASVVTPVRTGLETLAELLEEASFDVPAADGYQVERDELVSTIREYLLPRLRDPDAAVVAAIVGPSGSGKSTLLNSLAGEIVSESGPIRPTTSTTVVWANADYPARYWDDFEARFRDLVGPSVDVVRSQDQLTKDLTLIDTPPLGSPSIDGRHAAEATLAVADICVFVTSASRYADASSWDFLHGARRRGVPILFVLNRLPVKSDEQEAVMADFAMRLNDAGLLLEADPSLLFQIPEAGEDARAGAVAVIRKELMELANPDFRHGLVDQTTRGAVRSVAERATEVGERYDDAISSCRRLRDIEDTEYGSQIERLRSELAADEYAKLVEHDHWPTVIVDLTGIVTRRAGVAAQATAARWSADATGAALIEHVGQGLWRHGHATTGEAQRLLEAWGSGLGDFAVSASPKGRLSRRVRSMTADHLWRSSLDTSIPPPKRVARKFGSAIEAARSGASEGLVSALTRSLEFDAARFGDAISHMVPRPTVGERIRQSANGLIKATGGGSHQTTNDEVSSYEPTSAHTGGDEPATVQAIGDEPHSHVSHSDGGDEESDAVLRPGTSLSDIVPPDGQVSEEDE